MIEPKDGEWWMCEMGDTFRGAMFFNGNIWSLCERLSIGAYSSGIIKPLYKMEKTKPEPPKQLQYRYEKVIDTGFFELKDEFQGKQIYFDDTPCSDGKYKLAMDIKELAHHFLTKNLYRRIELTPEELHEQEVEELAREAGEVLNSCQYRKDEAEAIARWAIKKLKG